MTRNKVPSVGLPLLLSALSLLFVSIAYLPIESNSLTTIDLSEYNFAGLYRNEAKIGEIREYIPGWKTESAQAYEDRPSICYEYYYPHYHYTRHYKYYTYKYYGYTMTSRSIHGPLLPYTIGLNDTNYCDEYSIGPWGVWANSKTNGVSHSVLKTGLGRSTDVKHFNETNVEPYNEPYALKNNAEYKAVVNIWDIVTEYGGPGYSDEDWDGILSNLRLAIILLSVALFLVLWMYAFGPTKSSTNGPGRVFLFILFFLASLALTLASIVKLGTSLKKLKHLREGFNDLQPFTISSRKAPPVKMNNQLVGLLAAALALSVVNIFATLICGSLTIKTLGDRADQQEQHRRNEQRV